MTYVPCSWHCCAVFKKLQLLLFMRKSTMIKSREVYSWEVPVSSEDPWVFGRGEDNMEILQEDGKEDYLGLGSGWDVRLRISSFASGTQCPTHETTWDQLEEGRQEQESVILVHAPKLHKIKASPWMKRQNASEGFEVSSTCITACGPSTGGWKHQTFKHQTAKPESGGSPVALAIRKANCTSDVAPKNKKQNQLWCPFNVFPN